MTWAVKDASNGDWLVHAGAGGTTWTRYPAKRKVYLSEEEAVKAARSARWRAHDPQVVDLSAVNWPGSTTDEGAR
jgi:hypothetical protein